VANADRAIIRLDLVAAIAALRESSRRIRTAVEDRGRAAGL